MTDLVRTAFDRFFEDGPESVRDLLDPDVEMLTPDPGPWDCHGREAVLRFLYGFQAGGGRPEIIEVSERGNRVLLGIRQRSPEGEIRDGYSLVSLRDGRVLRMQGYQSREAALGAAGLP